ncbi:MAG: prolipoprotein diacylglyceryl transferase [Holophaga sp.]|nr:prolipoprotein diacylglyceryl transferase [Holophaga sp.]
MHPILFKIGSFPIGTYGLLLTLGFFLALILAQRLGRREGLAPEAISDLAITLLLAGVVGSKLLMIIVDLCNGVGFKQVFDLGYLRAGGAIHGGIIGATLAFFWRVRRLKLPLAQTLDCLTPAVALGQAVGRLGCFSAGCCYGTSCTLPWAVTFTDPNAQILSGTPLAMSLHPVQLYTAFTNLLIMVILLVLRKYRRFVGQIAGCYFILEGIGRIVTEHWRGDLDRGFLLDIPWLSTGRATSCLFILFGVGMLAWFSRRARTAVMA